MVKATAVFFVLAAALFAQPATSIHVSTTATQAILSYTAPDTNACTVQVSESAALTPLVHDVDPSLFAGAAADNRAGSINVGTQRTVVIGKRDAETALDGKRYSRALQAFTQHYYSITCDGNAAAGSFVTGNPPLGNLSSDPPPFDTGSFGNYGWPTIDWTNSDIEYIDPFTGILVKRVTFPGSDASIDSTSQYTLGRGVEDGATFNAAAASCTGSKWTNPCAALVKDGNYATYAGAGGDPLEISYAKEGYHTGGYLPEQGGLTNFQINITGYGSDANAANREISLCLSLHVFTGVCDTTTVTLTLPQGAAGTVTYPASIAPDQFMSAWLDATHLFPLSILDVTPKTVNVSASGSAITWTGDPANVGAWFDTLWRAGDHINIPGSSPACPFNECTISLVNSATSLSTVQSPSGVTGSATATNFGAILSKVTGTGSINIDSITNVQATEEGYNNYAGGTTYYFSPTQISVCVDRNGNPIHPCRNAYSAHVPAQSTNAWILFFPDTGESRFVDTMRPPNQPGVDGYSNVYCPNIGAAIDGANPMKSWCTGTSPDLANVVLVSGTYQYNSSDGCDYRHFSGYFTGENPCITWVNETPYSTNNDLVTKAHAIWPAYNQLYDGSLAFTGMDRSGRYIYFSAVQGYGPAQNGSNRFGAVLIFDTTTKTFVQKFDTYSTYPGRFGQIHGEGDETYFGYTGAFIAIYNYTGPRGAAPYTFNVTNIAGRADVSLDPGFQIVAASISGGVTHLTTTPHQLASSANAQVYLGPMRGNTVPILYAKVIDATHLDLYHDAAFTQPVSVYSNLASVPYPAPGDTIWSGQTFFAQACPAGLSAQWQAMGAVAGAANCVTMTLASDPVKQVNLDTLASNGAGPSPVLKVNVLSGGTGYSSPTCSIAGGGGSSATCTATATGGVISSVQVTNQGSAYSYPRIQVSQGVVTATAAAMLSGNTIGSIQVDLGGLYTSTPTVSIWTGAGNGTGAAATAVLSNAGSVYQLTLSSGGSGYFGPTSCAITGGGGSGATCTVQYLSGNAVGGLVLTNGGSGYTSTPSVVISGAGTGATASVVMAYPVGSITVTNHGSGYSMPVVSLGGGGTGAIVTAGLNEELTYHPYPHNASSCGGDGTTSHCWSQPLTLQEGDAFGFMGPPQNPYAEQAIDEKPFFVKVTHNGDGSITGIVARFLGACAQSGTLIESYPQYLHTAIPILPQMNPSQACWDLSVNYALTDTSLSNPLPDSIAVNHGDTLNPALSGVLPIHIENDQTTQLFRVGGPPQTIGQPFQYSSAAPGTFAGTAAHFTPNFVQTHPSTRQWNVSSTNEARWYLDSRVISNSNGSVTQVFQANSTQVGSCTGTTCIYDVSNPYNFDPKRVPLAAWAGRNLLQDVSGPAALLSAAAPWQYCYAYNSGECVSGGVQGHLYMVVDKATAGTGAWCGVNYFVNTPCAIPANPEFEQDVQSGMDKADSVGVYWRRLGRMWRAWNGNIDGFTNTRATPDGSWAFTPRAWANGVHCDWFAMKLPPWPGSDAVTRSGFVPIPIALAAAPGAVNARIRFGYAENGPPSSFFCTTRQEACTTSGNPFAYASESQSNTQCAAGCTVSIPAIAGRVVYYEIDRLDNSGTLVSAGPLQVTSVP